MTHKPPMHVLTNCAAHDIRPASGSTIAIFGERVEFDGCERIFAGTDADGHPLLLWPSCGGRELEEAGRKLTYAREHHTTEEER